MFAVYQVPDYQDLIKNPMDFATIRRKVDLQAYRTVDDVAADFQLMISNCMTYNSKNTIFYRAAVKLKNQVGDVLLLLRRIVTVVLLHIRTTLTCIVRATLLMKPPFANVGALCNDAVFR